LSSFWLAQIQLRITNGLEKLGMLEKEIEENYLAFFEHSLELLSVGSPQGYFLKINPLWEELTGFTEQELTSRPLVEFLHPSDRKKSIAEAARIWRGAEEGARSVTFETRFLCKNGNYIWLTWTTRAIGGQFYGIAKDITEYKNLLQRIAGSERQFRALADSAPVLIWVSGLDKLINYVNKGWTDFTGCDAETQLGSGWLDRVHPDDLNRILEIYKTSFELREPFSMEYRLLGSDGAYRWFINNGTPIYNPGGAFNGYMGSCMDITELIQTNERLASANEEMLQFSYRVSHDLMGPLKTCSGYLGLLREEIIASNKEAAIEYLDAIEDRAKRLMHLAEDVMDLARSDVLDENLQAVSLSEILRNITVNHQDNIRAQRIEVRAKLGVETLQSHPVRIHQILDNLISNAIKYHDPQKQVRYIEVETWIKADHGIHIQIRDNGLGIAIDNPDNLFNLFVKGSSSHAGSGLGLYIVKKHAQFLGGRISCTSPRNDTIFQLVMPQGGSV
jgi:PAS domain S-box-containing protein